MLSGKKVLIGITAGIAAYKICELIRMFKRANAFVRVVCTPNTLNFVSKLTLQTLSQNDVGVDEFNIAQFKPEHISYADEADVMVIAPATANTIGKLANGICDNLLTSIACAFKKPILLAPAMNTGMWENCFVQENIQKLKNSGYQILEPESGFLACGTDGKGRLCDLNTIFEATVKILNTGKKLIGQKIVITAGGTIEEIDSVRYISNYSSGKMGVALADCAYSQGADVILVSTVETQKPYRVVKVKSAQEMEEAVNKEFDGATCIIMAAAVADYRAKEIVNHKMKKTEQNEISVQLVKNPDILKNLCQRKSEDSPIIIGFCAESENLLQNAKEKITRKGCDFLVANDISRKDIGFSSDYNEVSILKKDGTVIPVARATKTEIASKILEVIYG